MLCQCLVWSREANTDLTLFKLDCPHVCSGMSEDFIFTVSDGSKLTGKWVSMLLKRWYNNKTRAACLGLQHSSGSASGSASLRVKRRRAAPGTLNVGFGVQCLTGPGSTTDLVNLSWVRASGPTHPHMRKFRPKNGQRVNYSTASPRCCFI